MVPDIEWPVEVDVSGIYAQLGNAFRGCFVSVPGGTDLALVSFAQNRALVFGRALLHLFCHRLYLSTTSTDIPLGDREYNVSLFNCFECLAKFGENTSAPLLKAMAHTLLAGGGYLFGGGGSFPASQNDSTWTLRLLPHLLAHPCCSLEVKMLAVTEIVRWHRWNPTYRGHPVRFIMDGPESAVYFLKHHFDLGDDVAVADALFILSQSRDVEQWASSSLFIDEIIRAMQDQREHVRHSALQVVQRMRHALASSETLNPAISANLHTIIPLIRFEANTGQLLCCLQVIFTFALHHKSTWIADFLQKHSGSCLRLADDPLHTVPGFSVYLLALLATVEDHNSLSSAIFGVHSIRKCVLGIFPMRGGA